MKRKTFILMVISLMSHHLFSQDYAIYVGPELSLGYGMGVDTNKEKREWLSNQNGFMKMEYPSGQIWGVVFITVGEPVDPPRPFKNFSGFSTLSLEMKGESGGEIVDIGIKDHKDPDDGTETKKTITVTNDWKIYEFPLKDFLTADLSHLYVVTEFVFGGSNGRTVYFKNVKYKK